MLSRMPVDTIDREDTPVVCVARAGTPDHIQGAAHAAWHDLEAMMSPHGRKLFGYWDPSSMEYRACYAEREDDDPRLERRVLPGGTYQRSRLKGDDAYERIGPAFDELAKDAPLDDGRPWLEVYRRRDEVDVLVPIKDG
jgi:DNA gyrase inhibitor GyrI